MDKNEKKMAEAICDLIDEYKTKKDTKALRTLMLLLIEAQVSVPMKVTMTDEDIEKFKQASVGDTVTTGGEVRMRPDLLTDDRGRLFFPAFTSMEETDADYRSSFSWITMDFMNCCHSVLSNNQCEGVVLNGFSNALVLGRPLLEIMAEVEKKEE